MTYIFFKASLIGLTHICLKALAYWTDLLATLRVFLGWGLRSKAWDLGSQILQGFCPTINTFKSLRWERLQRLTIRGM